MVPTIPMIETIEYICTNKFVKKACKPPYASIIFCLLSWELRCNAGFLRRFALEISHYCRSIPQNDDSIDQFIIPRTAVFNQ